MVTGSEQNLNAPRQPSMLRRSDQGVIALLVAAALISIVAYWYLRGGPSGDLIEIETDVPVSGGSPLMANYTVDLNSADWPEFEPLPNVGERMARRIVESRETDGPFQSIDDLDRIDGIGRKTIERLRPYLRIGDPTNASGANER
jgi:competence protein ComEA